MPKLQSDSMKYKFIAVIASLVLCLPLGAQQYTTVEAPEAPFIFEPLKMYVFPAKDFPITKYGAKPGDVKANTAAFAKAMAACHKAGGGRVVVPAGEWLTGPSISSAAATSF